MNQFLADTFAKLMGIFAAILFGVVVISGLMTMSYSFFQGILIIAFGGLGVVLVFGALAVILSMYEELKIIRAQLQLNQTNR